MALKTPTGINPDQIIEIKELRFEESELKTAETGAEVAKILRFDGDGGTYTIGFRARMRGQGAWRFCSKCRALFWNGHKDRKGVCAGGGSHVAQGLTFFLPHDRPIRPKEERCRFCTKCMAMFRSGTGLGGAPGNPGICPGGILFGEGHQAEGFRLHCCTTTAAQARAIGHDAVSAE
jgi:hypothetical protein